MIMYYDRIYLQLSINYLGGLELQQRAYYTVRESRIFVETSKSRPTHARLRNRELAGEAELVSLSVGQRVVDRWKKMIPLVHIVKQKQTHGKERE